MKLARGVYRPHMDLQRVSDVGLCRELAKGFNKVLGLCMVFEGRHQAYTAWVEGVDIGWFKGFRDEGSSLKAQGSCFELMTRKPTERHREGEKGRDTQRVWWPGNRHLSSIQSNLVASLQCQDNPSVLDLPMSPPNPPQTRETGHGSSGLTFRRLVGRG